MSKNIFSSKKKLVCFRDAKLFILINTIEIELGPISTRKGKLTRKQKLQAVGGNGDWVEV